MTRPKASFSCLLALVGALVLGSPASADTWVEAIDLGGGYARHALLRHDEQGIPLIAEWVSETYPIHPPAPAMPPQQDVLDARITRMALCESGGRSWVVGFGTYLGYLQFEPRTWEETKRRMGMPWLDVWNASHQHMAAKWLLLRGESWRWPVCWGRSA